MSASDNARERLILLKKKYALQVPEKIGQIEAAISVLPEEGPEGEMLEKLVRMAHTLSGSSSTMGFSTLGRASKKLEMLLKGRLENSPQPWSSIKPSLDSCIAEMRSQGLDIDTAPESLSSLISSAPVVTPPPADRRLIYLAEDDSVLLQSLTLQLGHFGYGVVTFSSPSGLIGAVQEKTPAAIIADITFSGGDETGILTIETIKEKQPGLPAIFISNDNDLNTRLRAARAGGDAYLLKPFSISSLIDKLDFLMKDAVSQDPYRILLIEDDPELGSYNSIILQQAGMKTTVVTNPLEVMSPLIDFNPDLILMDMYMPGCSGFELAKVIRQIEAFVSIPIVFLSSETDLHKQLSAMSMGGDDFLTKPIQPGHLISSVSTRVERMRIIRSFMDRDSLTGLLNHTKTKEHLDLHLERALRTNAPLAFAMIDIDKFKTVNDTYGHPAGDRVILSLSRLLQQRLRKTDVIGRYGGEEFASVLLDTDAWSAKAIFDEIRESFSQIRHEIDHKEFSVTFSCGIASFPCYRDAIAVCAAADQALYKAKQHGRNRVLLAP